jgi:hypothetical protein
MAKARRVIQASGKAKNRSATKKIPNLRVWPDSRHSKAITSKVMNSIKRSCGWVGEKPEQVRYKLGIRDLLHCEVREAKPSAGLWLAVF